MHTPGVYVHVEHHKVWHSKRCSVAICIFQLEDKFSLRPNKVAATRRRGEETPRVPLLRNASWTITQNGRVNTCAIMASGSGAQVCVLCNGARAHIGLSLCLSPGGLFFSFAPCGSSRKGPKLSRSPCETRRARKL
jgi:hypothetical protein